MYRKQGLIVLIALLISVMLTIGISHAELNALGLLNTPADVNTDTDLNTSTDLSTPTDLDPQTEPEMYTIPEKVFFPSFENCGQYTNWTTSDEYNYRYTVPDPEQGEISHFYVLPNNIGFHYQIPFECPYESEAELFVLTSDSHNYITIGIQCNYHDISEQLSWGYIECGYSSEGRFRYAMAHMNVMLDGKDINTYTAFYAGNNQWTFYNMENPSQEFLDIVSPLLSLVDTQPIQIQYEGTLDLMSYLIRGRSNILYLPDDLQVIESQAFTGVDVDEAVIPASVQSIEDDAFDDGVLLTLPDDRLEDWAREYHSYYRIAE